MEYVDVVIGISVAVFMAAFAGIAVIVFLVSSFWAGGMFIDWLDGLFRDMDDADKRGE